MTDDQQVLPGEHLLDAEQLKAYQAALAQNPKKVIDALMKAIGPVPSSREENPGLHDLWQAITANGANVQAACACDRCYNRGDCKSDQNWWRKRPRIKPTSPGSCPEAQKTPVASSAPRVPHQARVRRPSGPSPRILHYGGYVLPVRPGEIASYLWAIDVSRQRMGSPKLSPTQIAQGDYSNPYEIVGACLTIWRHDPPCDPRWSGLLEMLISTCSKCSPKEKQNCIYYRAMQALQQRVQGSGGFTHEDVLLVLEEIGSLGEALYDLRMENQAGGFPCQPPRSGAPKDQELVCHIAGEAGLLNLDLPLPRTGFTTFLSHLNTVRAQQDLPLISRAEAETGAVIANTPQELTAVILAFSRTVERSAPALLGDLLKGLLANCSLCPNQGICSLPMRMTVHLQSLMAQRAFQQEGEADTDEALQEDWLTSTPDGLKMFFIPFYAEEERDIFFAVLQQSRGDWLKAAAAAFKEHSPGSPSPRYLLVAQQVRLHQERAELAQLRQELEEEQAQFRQERAQMLEAVRRELEQGSLIYRLRQIWQAHGHLLIEEGLLSDLRQIAREVIQVCWFWRNVYELLQIVAELGDTRRSLYTGLRFYRWLFTPLAKHIRSWQELIVWYKSWLAHPVSLPNEG